MATLAEITSVSLVDVASRHDDVWNTERVVRTLRRLERSGFAVHLMLVKDLLLIKAQYGS
jgi:hypothetical protein